MYTLEWNRRNRMKLSDEEQKVLQTLLWYGPLSKQHLAAHTHLSRSKVGQVLEDLASGGWIVDIGQQESSGGRKANLYSLNPGLGYLIGIDLGVSEVKIALADTSLNIVGMLSHPIETRAGAGVVMATVARLIDDLLKQHSIKPERLISLAMGVPSPIERGTGLLVSPPVMPNWEGFSIQEYFVHRLAVPVPVYVDNDTNLMALGELWNARRTSEGEKFESFMVLKLSTGIGAGIVIAGNIYRGAFGGAGEIGHIPLDPEGPRCNCGQTGCLEVMAGARAILRSATEAGQRGQSEFFAHILKEREHLTVTDVSQAASEGDSAANAIIQAAGLKIGQVLAGLTNVLCPSHILIGGELAHIGPLMLAGIRQSVYGRAMPLATRKLIVDYTRLGDHAGLMGSLAYSMLSYLGQD